MAKDNRELTQKLKDMGLVVSRYQYRDRRTGAMFGLFPLGASDLSWFTDSALPGPAPAAPPSTPPRSPPARVARKARWARTDPRVR